MQLQEFVKQRILLSERSESEVSIVEKGTKENFRDPIRKNNPSTFANLYEVKPPLTSSEKKKILNADRSILYRLVTAYEAGREVDLSAILQHELMPVPVSLAEINGTIRTGNKSILVDVLTENIKCPESITLEGRSALLIDGFALVAALGKPHEAKTFGDFADCYVNAVLRKSSKYQRVDVLFDRYRKHSIKATTRSRRSKGSARPVCRVIEGREVPLPIKWQAFLALGENKSDLAQFLSDELVRQAPGNITLVVSGGCADEEDVLCMDPALDVAILRSNHEEADTRFVLHAVNLNGIVDNIVVSARDTDVITLLLAHLSKIRSKVWICAGTSKKKKYIPLRDVHSSFNCDEWNTLLLFHALTGCDSTSFICGHSKKTAWKVLLDNFELLFPIVKDVLNDAAITSAELFCCRLYKTSETWLAGKVTSNKRCFQTTLASMSLSNCSLASSACPKTYTSKSNGNWLDATGRPTDSRFHDVGTNPESMLGNGFMQMHNWVCNSPVQV